MQSVGKLINSTNELVVTRLVISSSTRNMRTFFRESIHALLRLSSRLRPIPKWAGNEISRAHGNKNIFYWVCDSHVRYLWTEFCSTENSFGHVTRSQTRFTPSRYRTNPLNYGILFKCFPIKFMSSSLSTFILWCLFS